jgi:hypothetical protein
MVIWNAFQRKNYNFTQYNLYSIHRRGNTTNCRQIFQYITSTVIGDSYSGDAPFQHRISKGFPSFPFVLSGQHGVSTLDLVTSTSFQVLSNSLSTNPTALLYVSTATKSVAKQKNSIKRSDSCKIIKLTRLQRRPTPRFTN